MLIKNSWKTPDPPEEADKERAEADRQLDEVLVKLGFVAWRSG